MSRERYFTRLNYEPVNLVHLRNAFLAKVLRSLVFSQLILQSFYFGYVLLLELSLLLFSHFDYLLIYESLRVIN